MVQRMENSMHEFSETELVGRSDFDLLNAHNFKLSPSDFAFLYEECSRCYYLKVKYGISRPRTPMATIYKQAESAIVTKLRTEELSCVVNGAPRGYLRFGERWVRSRTISFPERKSTCFISGKFDLLADLQAGGYAVPDIKMSKIKDPYLVKYGRQLHSYAYALEHARTGSLSLSPIQRLGLIVFEPNTFTNGRAGNGFLRGAVNWIEIDRDDAAFMNFLAEVVSMLEEPVLPEASPDCSWCGYRGIGR
jgi:PD-(D/E)XK nuclease superfamily